MKKLMLSLFIAFGFSACSLNNDDISTDCGTDADATFTGFPLLCNYSVKTLPTNPVAIFAASQEKLDQYFTKHENTCGVASDPNIDFSKNMLVGVFAGAKPTTGYTIKMTSMIENNCEILINFYESGPQTGEAISQTPTYPSDFIIIPKTTKPIIFNRTLETGNNVVIGTYTSKCTGPDCQKFFQINDSSILKYLNVVVGKYEFEQYRYTNSNKKGDYTAFLKTVPTEILNLKGQSKTYGTPDSADQGGIYFQLRQGAVVTKVYIDKNDTADQSAEIKAFKKVITDKIATLK